MQAAFAKSLLIATGHDQMDTPPGFAESGAEPVNNLLFQPAWLGGRAILAVIFRLKSVSGSRLLGERSGL